MFNIGDFVTAKFYHDYVIGKIIRHHLEFENWLVEFKWHGKTLKQWYHNDNLKLLESIPNHPHTSVFK